MTLQFSDLLLILLYFATTIAFGLRRSSKNSRSLNNYFLSGRQLPWWLAGTSMVATTFAADTPLWVAGKVADHGISGNWLWWSLAAGGLLTVFFFARLWRRSGVFTDLELIEIRYGGRVGAFLRGFRALYTGFGLNCIVISWVNLALMRICEVVLPEYDPKIVVLICLLVTLLYVSASGLRGIAMADAFQFVVALGGCILLAFFALQHPAITAKGGLQHSLGTSFFNFLPDFDLSQSAKTVEGLTQSSSALSLGDFLAYVLILWWASWYPGSEPGGGGYITQRILSARDEKQGMLASLWFVIAHYCLRSWPWILAALAAAALYPHLEGSQKEAGFVYLIRDTLPSPWKGLLIAAFLGAYMSTLSTHLNWGASYMIHDFYKRFLVSQKSEGHYIFVARLVTLALALCSVIISFYLIDSIQGAWSFLLSCTAGMGFVLILRWYWWRINAWAELTAMIAPIFVTLLLELVLPALWGYEPPKTPQNLFVIVPTSVILILITMYLTPSENKEHLKKFYARIRPLGPGWYPVSLERKKGLKRLFLAWLTSIVLIYSLLFLIGSLLLERWPSASLCAPLVLISGTILIFVLRKEFSQD